MRTGARGLSRASTHAKWARGAAILASSFLAPVAAASPVEGFGFGSRAAALAGAVSAQAIGPAANYYNPARLALSTRTELSAGYLSVVPRLSVDGVRSPLDSARGWTFGLVVPGRVLDRALAVGIAGYLPDGYLTRARAIDVSWVRYRQTLEILWVAANLAFEPIEGVSLGAGVGFLATTRGGFGVTGTAVLPSDTRSEYDSVLRQDVDADVYSVAYPQVGLSVVPNEMLSFALLYRGTAKLSLSVGGNLEGELDAGLLAAPVRYRLESESIQSYLPQGVVLGTSVALGETTLVLELAWRDWSEFSDPRGRTETDFEVELPPSLTADLPPSGASPERPSPVFSDRFQPRAGIERRFAFATGSWFLRAGYAFDPSPTTERTPPDFVDRDRHLFSIGAGARWAPREKAGPELGFDTHASWSALPENAGPGGSRPRASGDLFSVGATLSLSVP